MLNQLRIHRDIVALEAFSSTDLSGFMSKIIPNIVANLGDFVSRFVSDEPPVPMTAAQQDFIKLIAKHSYLDLAPLAAYVPEGMKVPYLEYSAILDLSVDHASKIIDRTMAPYSLFLSQLISNKEAKFDSRPMDKVFADITKIRDAANLAIGKCFEKGSSRSEVKYGDVVARNADWPAVFQNTDHLSKEMNRVDRKMLNKKIKECNDLLEIIVNKIKRDEFEGVSPQVVTNLANGAYAVAADLEFFSVTYYKTMAYVQAVNQTLGHVKEVFKQ